MEPIEPKTPTQMDFRLLYCITAMFIVGLVVCTLLSLHADVNANTIVIIGGMVMTAAGFMITHFKQQTVERKLDQNTKITQDGATAASTNAKEASVNAKEAKDAATSAAEDTRTIKSKLNGGIDAAIAEGIAPVKTLLEQHTQDDLRNLAEIKAKFDTVEQYMHQRNHDIRGDLQTLTSKLDILLHAQEKKE